MLRVFKSVDQLKYGQLMAVYIQLNREKAALNRRKDSNAALLAAEQDMYDYLKYCFFKKDGSRLAVWECGGRYVSAVRVERFEDGWLITALETEPEHRRKGFGKQLLNGLLNDFCEPVYSHVHKDNAASLALHAACGFRVISDRSVLLDGQISREHYTLLRVKES